jgi:hypothetical protein
VTYHDGLLQRLSFEHDLFGKPLHTFPDHALACFEAMVRAATALFLSLFATPFAPETVDVRGRGVVDLKTFECRDTGRSTIVQRVCYDAAGSTLLVAVRGAYHQFCSVPAATYAAFMDAPSMGLFFNRNVRAAASGERYRCGAQTAR